MVKKELRTIVEEIYNQGYIAGHEGDEWFDSYVKEIEDVFNDWTEKEDKEWEDQCNIAADEGYRFGYEAGKRENI